MTVGAIGVALAHAVLYGSWLIDDAGISLAYARNLLRGEGLVAAAGSSRVEGFSNPLWTLLLVPLSNLDGTWRWVSIKALSGALLASSLIAWRHVVSRTSRSPRTTVGLVVFGTALQPAVVIWSFSGLENALTLLLTALVAASVREMTERDERQAPAILTGSLAAALALTRPDAVLISFAGLAVAPLVAAARSRLGVASRALGTMVIAFVAPLGSYLLFRRIYYGEWLPNTYYAKPSPSLRGLTSEAKLRELCESALGPLGLVLVAAAVLGWLLSSDRTALTARVAIAAALGAGAVTAYLVLPADWMGEYRFATATFPLLIWGVAEGVGELVRVAFDTPLQRRCVSAVLISVIASLALPRFVERALMFAVEPPVPLEAVGQRWGSGWNGLARRLGDPKQLSFLLPDVGGALLGSELKLYDLGGLCDRNIAQLSRQAPSRLAEYVYEELRPTFIHIHENWVLRTRLQRDSRLRRDYFPLGTRFKGDHWRSWPESKGLPPDLVWGDFVRRDALEGRGLALDTLRTAYLPLGAGVDWEATRFLAGDISTSR